MVRLRDVKAEHVGLLAGGLLFLGGVGTLLHLALTEIQEKVSQIYQRHNLATVGRRDLEPKTTGVPEGEPTRRGASHKSPSNYFKDVDSSRLEKFPTRKTVLNREDFLNSGVDFPPPLIGKSDFVSPAMLEHLMRHKKPTALGEKYIPGDQITNMEGALHTFVTPVASILMTGDFRWFGFSMGCKGKPFGNNQVRREILSAAVQPDFEYDTVVMPLVKARKEAVIGAPLDTDDIPSADQKKNPKTLAEYEEKLLRHMIYHLSPDRRLPALEEIIESEIMNQEETKDFLEGLIETPCFLKISDIDAFLKGKFMRIGESTISLEILYRIYVHQVRNEFKVLDKNTPQGYVYTIDPPSIFAKEIGGATILNRLQALAFKSLIREGLFSKLKVLAFNDYMDKGMVSLFQKVFPKEVKVVSQDTLFDPIDGSYKGPSGFACVVHNNSDGFGDNITNEGPTSLDGVVGNYSSAACVLKQDRPDLLDFVD